MPAIHGAEIAARMHEVRLRVLWPPPKSETPALVRASGREGFESVGKPDCSGINHTTQRAIAFAMRRAATIDRTADLLLSIGRVDAAERLSRVAESIREVAA
jgi:hypothetical protein